MIIINRNINDNSTKQNRILKLTSYKLLFINDPNAHQKQSKSNTECIRLKTRQPSDSIVDRKHLPKHALLI